MQRCIRALRRRYGTENGDKSHSILYPGVGSAHPLRRRRVSAGLTRHSGRFFADQTGTDPHGRTDGICTRLFAFPHLAEHRRNDTGHCRPHGKHCSPCRLADVSGKVPQECRHGGDSGAQPGRTGNAFAGKIPGPACGRL